MTALVCAICGGPLVRAKTGPPPKYCPGECRAEAARRQQRQKWERHGDRYNAKRRRTAAGGRGAANPEYGPRGTRL